MPILHRYIWKFTRSDIDTEEVLQETFIRIWIYRDRLPDVDNLPAWIRTIAARVCFNYLRASFNQQKKIKQSVLRPEFTQTDWNTPLSFVQMTSIRKDIQMAVQLLSHKQRVIYRMNREEGIKPGVIAEVLGISAGTVRNQLSSALRDIRDYLIASGHQLM